MMSACNSAHFSSSASPVGAEQRDAAFLVGEVLGMLERQVEELRSRRLDLPVEASRQRPVGDRARQRIGGKGARAAAEHVARKLVEHDGQRQRALGRAPPSPASGPRRRLHRFRESAGGCRRRMPRPS